SSDLYYPRNITTLHQQPIKNSSIMLIRYLSVLTIAIAAAAALVPSSAHAQIRQDQQLYRSQQFRLGERSIRVAEPGELADSVHVSGDADRSGRHLVPNYTRLPDLSSYAVGPQSIRSNEADLDWAKMRVEVNSSEYSSEEGMEEVQSFKYKFEEPLPGGMRDFELENNQ